MGIQAAYYVDLASGEIALDPNETVNAMIDYVEPEEWLNAISDAKGLPRQKIAYTAGYEHETVYDLATGQSASIHMDTIHRSGPPAGFRLESGTGALDFLDALRAAHGLQPCDREIILAEITSPLEP